jgi:hypothetical protein
VKPHVRPSLLLLLFSLLLALPARAAPPSDEEEPSFAPRIELRDIASEAALDAPRSAAPLWISLAGGATLLPEGTSFNAMVVLGVPLERLGRPSGSPQRSHARYGFGPGSGPGSGPVPGSGSGPVPGSGSTAMLAEGPEPPLTLKPPPRARATKADASAPASAELDDAAPVPVSPLSGEKREEPIAIPLIVSPDAARIAVRAALRHAKLLDPAARVDALATRARTSALLPELRFRVSRLVDEEQQLSPTEYDAGRITASGGTSLWLEARATWRLDRLVFTDDEVALERMRHDRYEAQAKLTERVLALLFAWQKARALELSPGKSPEAQLTARLAALEAEASLDVLTDGWFSRWRRLETSAP